MVPIGELWIQNEQEVHFARQWTQKLARLTQLTIGNQARLTTAVSQIAQSLHFFNQCVQVVFAIEEEAGKQTLQITLREAQNFIPPVEKPQPRLSRLDLLKWLGSTQKLIARFSLRAEEGTPIEVTLAKPIPSWMPPITDEAVNQWREALQNEIPQSLLEEILQQNQELVQVLDEVREKDKALEQKITEIQKLENLRDELVHALIHDLRNPLASIRASLSGLLYNDTRNLSPYQAAMIEISYLGARKMTRLVNNILDVHKLEQGGIPLEFKPFSISELVQKVMKAQGQLAFEKNIRLSKRVAQDVPLIDGDVRLIERVLQNLMDNALKFTPEGGRILITVKCLDPQGKTDQDISHLAQAHFVAISVKDTGTGISPELDAHLFEKFIAGVQEETGSGLGLAFCRMAVQAHGGEIWARNNPQKGTTFTFILPFNTPTKDVNDD